MGETCFTPGPWRVAGKASGRIHYAGSDPEIGTVEIAIVGDYRDKELLPFNRDRWDADARLIAAAPNLYEALKEMLEMGELFIPAKLHSPGFKRARAALAKVSPQAHSSEDDTRNV